ncbi:MAG: SOS response-associated peptidase, partial [Desulfomonilaceae bacterium]
MCGRFVLMTVGRDIAEHFQLSEEPELEPRYNIAPTQIVAVVRLDPETTHWQLRLAKWGLVPFWAKDPSIGSRLINARAESAADKPAFRAAFKHRRCLVPADGFYEWERAKKNRQPYFFGAADKRPFAFAGLWEHWEGPDGAVIESCTVLTTDSNELLQPIHDRMPVILKVEDYDRWLDPTVKKVELLQHLLKPYPSEEMIGYPVTSKVNKAAYEGPDCIKPVD